MKAMRTFTTEAEAEQYMRMINSTQRMNSRPEFVVLVDGPEDDYAVMPLRDAIENEFLYRWTV